MSMPTAEELQETLIAAFEEGGAKREDIEAMAIAMANAIHDHVAATKDAAVQEAIDAAT